MKLSNIHLWIFEFNKKYEIGEHIGEVRCSHLNSESKLAEIYHYRDNEQGYFEIRTPTGQYPDDISKEADVLIGIYPTEKEIKAGVRQYYKGQK